MSGLHHKPKLTLLSAVDHWQFDCTPEVCACIVLAGPRHSTAAHVHPHPLPNPATPKSYRSHLQHTMQNSVMKMELSLMQFFNLIVLFLIPFACLCMQYKQLLPQSTIAPHTCTDNWYKWEMMQTTDRQTDKQRPTKLNTDQDIAQQQVPRAPESRNTSTYI